MRIIEVVIALTDEESSKLEEIRAELRPYWGYVPTDSGLAEVLLSNFLASYPRGDEGINVFSAAMRAAGDERGSGA